MYLTTKCRKIQKKRLTNPGVGVIIDKKQIHSKPIVFIYLIEKEDIDHAVNIHYPAAQEFPVRTMYRVISKGKNKEE